MFMYKVILLLFMVLLITGCSYEIVSDNITGDSIVCNKPYIRIEDDCCLDKDDNGICDRDEKEDIDNEVD